jgi:tetratricopeptide (TPR) repeat protein
MADKKVQDVEEVVEVNESLETVKGFWERNKKVILGLSTAIIVVIGGYYIYKNFIQQPKEDKAAEAMFRAEEYYQKDSLDVALNGDGQNKGFLYVANNYDGTKAGNLAHFYAGVIYLKKQDFNNAIKHLKDFSTDSKQIQMLAYGRLADAYSEANKKEDAVEYYKKAGKYFPEDEYNSSEFLFRAGYLLEAMNKNNEAVEQYKVIKEKYPRTEKGFTIDKYIYRLSIEKNDFSVK